MVNVKVEIVKRGAKIINLVKKLEEKKKKKLSYESINDRIRTNTLRLQEAEEILDVLGCRLLVVDKNDEIFLNKEA